MVKHILVPTDGSEVSLKAAKAAADLARTCNARMTAVFVMPPWEPPSDNQAIVSKAEEYSPVAFRERTEKTAQAALSQVREAARQASVECESLAVTNPTPWEAIIESAEKSGCDMIVMGSRGRGSLAGVLLGSQTQKVLSHTKTPVLVCR